MPSRAAPNVLETARLTQAGVDAIQNPERTPSDVQVQREFAQRASNLVTQHRSLLLQVAFSQYLLISL